MLPVEPPRYHDSPAHLPKSKTSVSIGKNKETGPEVTALYAEAPHLSFPGWIEKKAGKTSLFYLLFPLEKERHSIFKEKACYELLTLQNILLDRWAKC